MSHKLVYDSYKALANVTDADVKCWFPNGNRSVRVRLHNGQEVVFTYYSPVRWRIETIDLFVEKLGGDSNERR